jgi:hypothetical protein
MTIKVTNFKDHKSTNVLDRRFGQGNWIYVGRQNKTYGLPQTALGNPYRPTEKGIGETIENYRKWLWEKIQKRDADVMEELRRIVNLDQDTTINGAIVCWCSPCPCHADVILSAVRSEKVQGIINDWWNEQYRELTLPE